MAGKMHLIALSSFWGVVQKAENILIEYSKKNKEKIYISFTQCVWKMV